jgi:hypothetical protein
MLSRSATAWTPGCRSTRCPRLCRSWPGSCERWTERNTSTRWPWAGPAMALRQRRSTLSWWPGSHVTRAHTSAACSVCGYMSSASCAASTGSWSTASSSGRTRRRTVRSTSVGSYGSPPSSAAVEPVRICPPGGRHPQGRGCGQPRWQCAGQPPQDCWSADDGQRHRSDPTAGKAATLHHRRDRAARTETSVTNRPANSGRRLRSGARQSAGTNGTLGFFAVGDTYSLRTYGAGAV